MATTPAAVIGDHGRTSFNPPRSNVAGTRPPDLTGRRFHGWAVIARGPSQHNRARYVVRCDCGRESLVLGSSLRSGYSRACHDLGTPEVPKAERCGVLLWDDPRFPCEGFVGHTGHTWNIRGHQIEVAT